MGSDEYPMRPEDRLQAAPRCRARSKRTGEPCKGPAVRGRAVCRMHGARGGTSPGPGHPAYRHGARSREGIELRRMAAEITRDGRRLAEEMEDDR